VLSYLHSLGVHTWPDQIAERYDELADDQLRLTAAVDAAMEFISRAGTATLPGDQTRAANVRWLVRAPKPWDRLVGEWTDTVRSLP
jgi:hypothetical protein